MNLQKIEKLMTLQKILMIACLSILLTACGTMPASGPYSSQIKRSGKVNVEMASINNGDKTLKFAVAEINPTLLDYVAKQAKKLSARFSWPDNAEAEEITVNVGDTITVAIFESQSGGLFIPEDSSVRPGNFVSLPPQTIDATGMITVPYAGSVQAAGNTTDEISQIIEERLEDKAIEPQVVVSFNSRGGAEISVIGDVNNAQRLSLGFNKYRVLDAIASAGGPTSPGYETKVSLQREEKEYTIPFDELVLDPEKNIYSKINDILYLYREPKTFTAYGAVQAQGTIDFGKRNLVLSEALGLTRGLTDTQADPAEIYIYRQRKYPYFKPVSKSRKSNKEDPVSVVKTLDKTKPEEMVVVEDVSVIFKLDMRKPSSFFLAQNFEMEDRDIVYVANAKSVEFLKFLNILGNTSSTTTTTNNVFPL